MSLFMKVNDCGHVIHTSDDSCAIAIEGDVTPVGDPTSAREGDVNAVYQSASRHWKYIAPRPVRGILGRRSALIAGDHCELVPGYYRSFQPLLGEGDYCLHCGAFNGPQGEFRNNFDCYSCGSN